MSDINDRQIIFGEVSAKPLNENYKILFDTVNALKGQFITKSPVNTFNDIAIIYPTPDEGWGVYVNDEHKVYRWSNYSQSWEEFLNFEVVGQINHAHDNKPVLDLITVTDIEKWNANTGGSSLKYGTVASNYVSGNLPIIFDGESIPSAEFYPYVSSYKPKAGDNVVLSSVGDSYIVLGAVGIEGSKGNASYTYTQNTPSSLWDVVHNLGYYPFVTVIDSGKTPVYGDLRYIDLNRLTIQFSAEFSGIAYLI